MENPLIFYWPTTLIMVDDNLAFLENISFQLREKRLRLAYDNPKKALEILKTKTVLIEKISTLVALSTSNEHDEDISLKKLDYSVLPDLIYEKSRFSMISTVLVDYSMPEMDGLEFCRNIKDMPIKKIMLTGELGDKLAISAFNEGIIDAFMVKNLDSLVSELNDTIVKMKKNYFSDMTLDLMGKSIETIKQNSHYLISFNQFLRDKKIQEYYQIDSAGSYLGLDSGGCAHWLIIRSEDNFNEALNVLKYSGDPEHLSAMLYEKSHLLFLFSEIEKKMPVSTWNRFLFPVITSFEHKGKLYYCAMISGEIFSLDKKEIMGLDGYLENRRKDKVR